MEFRAPHCGFLDKNMHIDQCVAIVVFCKMFRSLHFFFVLKKRFEVIFLFFGFGHAQRFQANYDKEAQLLHGKYKTHQNGVHMSYLNVEKEIQQ